MRKSWLDHEREIYVFFRNGREDTPGVETVISRTVPPLMSTGRISRRQHGLMGAT